MNKSPAPDFRIEDQLHARGYRFVAGVDEVGRGALAGPVMASAVVLPAEARFDWLDEVRDSKLLSPEQRERLAPLIQRDAVAFATGLVAPETIDAIGIAPATRTAMRQAVKQLSPRPDYVLIDYFDLPRLGVPNRGVEHGDESCLSIACASIVAKVARDTLMCELADQYPGYDFSSNKGYGTAEHLAALQARGACRIHRTTFEPVAAALPPAATG